VIRAISTPAELFKVFCPTGEGGGIDPTCSLGGDTHGEVTLYRGWASGGKGHYFTTDAEWARQFTQSGLESEVQTIKLKTSEIYRAPVLPKAFGTNESDIDNAIRAAKAKGFKAIWVNEGQGQPNSVFLIKPMRRARG